MSSREEREIARITRCDVGVEDHGCLYFDLQFEGPGWGQGLGRIFDENSLGPAVRALIHLFSPIGYGYLSRIKGSRVYVVRDKNGSIARLEPLLSDEGRPVDFADEDDPDYFMKSRKT